MLVTITQFSSLAYDVNGNPLPMGKTRTACEKRTAAGAFAPLASNTKFIRLATDTAIQMDVTGGTTDTSDELFPANSSEYVAVNGGETLTIALA